MAGGVEFGGSSEERRQGVAATLVAQDEDELDAGGHLSGDVPLGPVAVDGAPRAVRRSPGRTGRSLARRARAGASPSGSSQRSSGTRRAIRSPPPAEPRRGRADSTGQNLRRPLPIGVGETEAERTIEAVALDQCVDASRTARANSSPAMASPTTRRHRSWIVNSPWSETPTNGRGTAPRPDRRPPRRSHDATVRRRHRRSRRDGQHVPLGVVEVIEHRLEHVFLGAADAVCGGHPTPPPATRRSTSARRRPRRGAASATISGGENSSCSSPISSTAPATRSCASPRTRSRPASTKWTDEGASVTSRATADLPRRVRQRGARRRRPRTPERPPPPQLGQEPLGRRRARLDARRAAIRPRSPRGDRSLGVAPTSTSAPRGRERFSAIICSSSTDLPNPGPAVTDDGGGVPAARPSPREAGTGNKRDGHCSGCLWRPLKERFLTLKIRRSGLSR